MKDRLRGLIDYIKSKNIDYADARYVERKNESITVKDGQLEALSRDEGRGVGVRVLHGGCWGFAASASISSIRSEKVGRSSNRYRQGLGCDKGQTDNAGPDASVSG